MLRKFKSHASPAMVVAVLALIVALGGTAIAAGTALSGKQKKESGKIAGKVFSKRIGGASVAHANTADSANKANTANTANTATKAGEAGKADTATRANSATSATTADSATKAGDAERFGGRIPAEYQRKLNAGCLPPSAIAGISNEGDVTCAFPVKAISANSAFAEVTPIELANGLRILSICHDGGNVELAFQNVGGATAGQLGWISGTGATVGVGQESLPGGTGEKDFSFSGSTLELRIIYSISNQVMNINVDARDNGGAGCEVRGTLSATS